MSIKTETINIEGYSGLTVPNTYLRQNDDTNTLAVIFPGLHYSCDKPLLYYTTKLLINTGCDVLQLKTDYTRRDFQFSAREQRASWILSDAHAAVQSGVSQRPYRQVIFVGKSLGTLSIAGLVNIDTGKDLSAVWITPLLNQPLLVDAAINFKGRSLYIVGTGDDTYIPENLEKIKANTDSRVIFVENANHSLEIPNDINSSVEIIQDVMHAVGEFLDSEIS